MSAGSAKSNPASPSDATSESFSKSTPAKATVSGIAIPASASSRRFQRWVAGWSTSNTRTRIAGEER
jgi:hypothetical protein